MQENDNLDPVFSNDRNAGVTPPERGEGSTNIVGRPDEGAGFHERSEAGAHDREPFNGAEALDEGGSFDGLGVPVADDSTV